MKEKRQEASVVPENGGTSHWAGTLALALCGLLIAYWMDYWTVAVLGSRLHASLLLTFVAMFCFTNFVLPRTVGLRVDGSNWRQVAPKQICSLTALLVAYAVSGVWVLWGRYAFAKALGTMISVLMALFNMLSLLP